MDADQALDTLYKVANDKELDALDDLMRRAGFRTNGGEMRPVAANDLETLQELRELDQS